MIESLAQLTPDPRNARRHNPRNVGMLEKALNEVGAARSIVIDERGVVLAGNATIEAAGRAGIERVHVVDADGETLVAVRRTGLTQAQKTRLALYDNRTAELADWDSEVIADMLATEREVLDGLFENYELEEIVEEAIQPVQSDAEPRFDQAAELLQKWKVEAGDLWLVGEHRLLCGDSTSAADVARVLGDGKPVLMVTDPPYGVNYNPAWRAEAGVNKNKGKMGKVANDDSVDWSAAWILFTGDVAYIYHSGVFTSTVQVSLENTGFKMRAQIIWAKDRMALSRGDYHWQHEPCWYAVRDGKPGHRNNDRKQTTLWQIPARDDSGHGHSTQKPLECMARPMRNHEAPEVYDPFLGSGSTMVAAQNLQRKCYGIEISPAYCAVILERMQAAFPDIKIERAS